MLEIIKSKVNQTTVTYVNGLLERCESGETIAVTVLEEYPGGTYCVTGSSVSKRLETAGMLLDAAITRLGGDD
jgi:hypothetical protein